MASHRFPVDSFNEVGIPSGGMDTDTVPRLLSPNFAPLLKNFLMDRPGVLPMRGPLCEGTTWDLGASIGRAGAWSFDDKLLIGRFAASATAIKDPWTTLYRYATSAPQVRAANNTLKLVDLAAGSVADVAATDGRCVPGPHSVRVGDIVYGISLGWTSNTQVRGASGTRQALTSLCRWDGSAATPVAYTTNAPQAAQHLTYHYNRLFVLGGTAPGGSGFVQPNTLWWSDQLPTDGTALPAAITAWQDDVSALTNQIVVGADFGHDFGVALAHVGTNLMILKRHSLWMLYGTASSNFSVKQVNNELGCLDARSVVEYNGGAYFMSDRGFMYYDGNRVQNASPGLGSTLTANALKQVGPNGVDGGYCRAVLLDHGYVLVTTGVMDGATLTCTADTDAWLLHAPTGAWTQLSSGALASVIAGGRTVNTTWLVTDTKLVKASYLFAPDTAPAGTRGVDSIDGGLTKTLIPSRWTTRTLSLGTPPRNSKLQRIAGDYYWSLANGGWQVTANTRGASGVASTAGTLAAPASIAATLPARGAIDIFNETDEVFLDIVAGSSAPATFSRAEIHRVLLESIQTNRVSANL